MMRRVGVALAAMAMGSAVFLGGQLEGHASGALNRVEADSELRMELAEQMRLGALFDGARVLARSMPFVGEGPTREELASSWIDSYGGAFEVSGREATGPFVGGYGPSQGKRLDASYATGAAIGERPQWEAHAVAGWLAPTLRPSPASGSLASALIVGLSCAIGGVGALVWLRRSAPGVQGEIAAVVAAGIMAAAASCAISVDRQNLFSEWSSHRFQALGQAMRAEHVHRDEALLRFMADAARQAGPDQARARFAPWFSSLGSELLPGSSILWTSREGALLDAYGPGAQVAKLAPPARIATQAARLGARMGGVEPCGELRLPCDVDAVPIGDGQSLAIQRPSMALSSADKPIAVGDGWWLAPTAFCLIAALITGWAVAIAAMFGPKQAKRC